MKRFGKTGFKQGWKKIMHSTQRKLSRGASNIIKIVSWARSDNWRRKQKEFKGANKGRRQ